MSDEEIRNFMEADSDDEDSTADYSSDDNDADPDYVPDAIESEVNSMITNAVDAMNSGETSYAFIESLNITLGDEVRSASSTLRPQEVAEYVEVEVEGEVPSTSAAASSSAALFKPPKRARSPLPQVEDDGPMIVPNNGGLIGSGMCITFHFIYTK